MRLWAALAVALLVAMLVIFGCVSRPPEPIVGEPPSLGSVQNETPPESQPCSSGNVIQKDECFLALAKTKSDPEVCKNIYSVERLDECYAEFANSNLEVCKRIGNADLKAACLTENANRMNSEESEAVCNLIEDVEKRSACLREVVPPCRLILDPVERSLCIALEKSDYSYCTADSCLFDYAKQREDQNACNLISTAAQKYACIAVVKGSASECLSAVAPQPVKDYCVEIASKRLDDVNGCDNAASGSSYRNDCYFYFATNKSDSSICARSAPEEKRDECYSKYARALADTSVCSRVVETLNRISCYYNAAAANSMPSLCNPLANEAQRNDCYAKGVQTSTGPVPSDCLNVNSQVWKDKCYYRSALSTYNYSLCSFISPGPDRESCEEVFPTG